MEARSRSRLPLSGCVPQRSLDAGDGAVFTTPERESSDHESEDFRHRALSHHTEGVFMAETIFGRAVTTSTGREVPVRFIREQHVPEDLGRIPTVADWLGNIKPETWMVGVHR
jgi:hypothetical protein